MKSKQEDTPRGDRLQKILAQAGIASRRAAEQYILEGRVQVNGQTVTELGTRADLEHDHVRVDGRLLHGRQAVRYFMLNKPRGYVTTNEDPEGRKTVLDLISQDSQKKVTGEHKRMPRLFPVGRLDYLSEGLLILTNDGDLANKLSKASAGVEKTYLVKVAGIPTEESLDILRRGVLIDRGRITPDNAKGKRVKVMTQPAKVERVRGGDNPWFEVTLTEGRNRQLRKMFEEVGHHVEKIRRIGYGALVLDVPPGAFRELTMGEVMALGRAAAGKKVERKKVMPEAAQLKKPVAPKRKRPTSNRPGPKPPTRRSRG
ncbi:ribosomal large subunit pseudouridine synthase B [Bryocella elongata]|uniref:Pseudouridine synthase n=1 Tax=Bryocella elongata TaxID=863522 RepID=A0A1H6AII4_9BACT|nr:pseudouridine synthase [Bryocella elongata]SEG48559.1 ribosomal large subunit pseudouridine synthase B [Bryocella elongata]